MNVFLFPGQGSHEVGMGADLFKSDPAFRALVQHASQCVGENLEPICLRGPEKKLVRTKFLQPLLVAVSLGYYRQLSERGVKPDVVLGHSLGEITALVAAGIVTPEAAVRIAAKRGELMEEASANVDGAMLAVELKERTKLLDGLAGAISEGRVVLANDNAPTQIVLSGERPALVAGAEFIAREKLGKCRFLSVSGPWHSPFMAAAAARFGAWLGDFPLLPPRVPILFNATALSATGAREICSLVSGVLAEPVLWRECMNRVRERQPEALFEIGPGRVLSGLARLNHLPEETRIVSVNNLRGVELAGQPSRAE
jgi:[acyl-carrier-protein] S-malonyltransferase